MIASDTRLKPFRFTTPAGQPYTLMLDTAGSDPYQANVRETGAVSNVARLLLDLCRPGDVVLDVGANVGAVSVPLAASGANVHAFEIAPENLASLYAAQPALNRNLTIVAAAAFSRDGMVSFAGAGAYASVETGGTRQVRSIRLDTYLRESKLPRVQFVKMDIEGAERDAFEGMGDMLAAYRPHVIFESNIWHCGAHGYSYRDLIATLRRQGYSVYRVLDSDRVLASLPADDFQEALVCDYFATTVDVEQLLAATSFSFTSARPDDKIAEALIADAAASPLHSRFAALAAETGPERLRTDPRIVAKLPTWHSAPLPAAELAVIERGRR